MHDERVGLIVSGGAAKGAAAAGAILAMQEAGYLQKIKAVSGTSVGSICAPFAMAEQAQRLCDLFAETREEAVHIPHFKSRWGRVKLASKFIAGKLDSLADNRPLRVTMQKHMDDMIRTMPFTKRKNCYAGVVMYEDKSQFFARPLSSAYALDWIHASTTIPVLWHPVKVVGSYFVDGGLRTQVPLNVLMPHELDLLICICLNPVDLIDDGKPDGIISTGARALSIILNQIANDDVDGPLRINDLVAQAHKQNAVLLNWKTRLPMTYKKIILMQPEKGYGGSLDFSKETQISRINNGYDAMKTILQQYEEA